MSETREQDLKINSLEGNYAFMAQQLGELKESMDKGFDKIMEEFVKMREENDRKYASKLTELIVYALGGLIMVSVFVAMLSKVLIS